MPKNETEILRRLDLIIEQNLENPSFSIENIYKDLGMSRSQLYRLLKEKFQLSTSLYIRRQRLLKAKYLLESTTLKITEVSYKVGLDSPQNFSKYFTQEFGLNPTEYRKNLKDLKAEDNSQVGDSVSLIEDLATPKGQKKHIHLGFSLLFLLLISLTFYYFRNSELSIIDENASIKFPENAIAILPFKNLGNAQESYYCEGVMEQIHSSLASLSVLKVISTTSSNKYDSTQKTIQQIAQELQVKYILNGSVLQLNKQIRIRVELIDAEKDQAIWSKSFEGDTKNMFKYMNAVSKEVAGELNQKLSANLVGRLEKRPTQNLDAYNDFLQGQQLLQNRTKVKIEASIIKFDQAIKLDPSFSDAYANRALAYFMIAEDQLMNVEMAYRIAEQNALTAIRLDAENGRAYAVLGHIYKAKNKWEQAITTYQIALKYSPNDAQINYWYSLAVRSVGLLDEAVKYSSHAVLLDPLSQNIYGGHIAGCAYAGKVEMATEAIKKGELIFNDYHLFHNAKAFFYITLKNYQAALKEFKICRKLNPKVEYFETMIAYTQAKLKQNEAAELYLKELQNVPDNYVAFAIVYAGFENKDLCLKYLELAAEKSESPNYLKVSPLFNFLHNDPRFTAVLQKLGLLNPVISLK